MAKKNAAAVMASGLVRPLERTNYFTGRVLVAEDYQREQAYHRRKQQLVNLAVLGTGVVAGLKVTSSRGRVRVTAGYAIDRAGREVIVAEDVEIAPTLNAGPGKRWYVVAGVVDEPAGMMPSMGEDGAQAGVMVERGVVGLLERAPAAGDARLVLGRITVRGKA